MQEHEELAKEHKQRISSHVVEHEELQNEIAALKESIKGKDIDIGHLMEECRQYKEEMGILYE